MNVIKVSLLIITIEISIIFGYNLDTKNPFILKYKNSSYFGYSIILHDSAMIVGAPKDNYSIASGSYSLPHEPGAVWKYIFNTGEWQQFRPKVNDDIGFVKSRDLTTLIAKKNGWFGASIALQEDNDLLTICAPRTMVYLVASIQGQRFKFYSMHGMCYTGNITTGNFQIEDPNLSSYDFSVSLWFHPLRGFSVHYPTLIFNETLNDGRMIMGCPKHEFVGSTRIEGQNTPVMLLESDDLSQFGYAVSSGRFFNRHKLLYVGGGPGSNLVGQVGIMDPNTDPATIISRLNGSTVGEYFGASLAVGDMNNDGLDDLIIGAPHWGNDNGRVYIYLGNVNGFLRADVILNGYVDDGMFGFAVTCGDLDADGFDDLIIGAPYGDDDAIYIYNGDVKINQEIERKFQKINMYSRIETFGFSLAKPVDIDANGFPDVGVGAYKSGHAIILKSRPVIKTNVQISTVPASLCQNSTNFLIKICVKHTEKNVSTIKSFILSVYIDEHFKRVNKTQVMLEYIPSGNMSVVTEICLNTTVHILENANKNYYEPINITVVHKFGQWQRLQNERIIECKLCPIEAKGVSSKSSQLAVPFDLGCGPDKVCIAVIELHANFDRNNSIWIIGSEDITYEIYITNYGEAAYSTEIIVEIPQGISLRTYLQFCDKLGDSTGISKIRCDVNNPLSVNETKNIKFILDMSRLNDGSANGTYLNFNVSVKTQSQNHGTENISTSLLLLSHIVTVLEGNADDENSSYTLDDETSSNIIFQHSYEVLKSGATPINQARLNIEVPTTLDDLELITLAEQPNIRISGKMYQCLVINIPLLRSQENITPVISKNLNNEKSRMTREVNELPQKILSAHEFQFDSITDDNVISLDCSSSNISCGKIICDIPLLKSRRDSVSLQLKFSTNLKLLWDKKKYNNEKYVVVFITHGWIEIIKPLLGSRKITQVRTIFRQVEKSKRLNIWIIVGSVLLGLLMLFIVAILLWKLGFFKREKKSEMEALRTQNTTSNLAYLQN